MFALLITVGVEVGVDVAIQVVADLAVARKHAIQHLLAINQQSQCLTNIVVIKWLDVNSHAECQPCTSRVFNDIQILLRRECLVLLERDVNRHINLLGDQRINECRLVCEVDDSNFIKINIFCIPVAVEALVHTLSTRRITHKAEGTRTNLGLTVVAHLGDCVCVAR